MSLPAMFCLTHLIPHEDCSGCRMTVATMRPTIFAELAAAELRSGTECCRGCDYIFYEAVTRCPQCGDVNPLHAQVEAASTAALEEEFIDLDALSRQEPLALVPPSGRMPPHRS